MPVGPSHSRSNSGSRGFSGGSRSSSVGGGFSGNIGFGGGHRHVHRGPVRIRWFGRTVIVSSGRQSAIVALILFLAFALFGCFITSGLKQGYNESINNSKAYIAQCELDAEWYQMAKQKAEQNIENDDFFITYATYSGQYKHYYSANNPTGFYYDEYTNVRVNNIPFYYLIYEYEVPEDKDGDGKNDIYEGETYSSFSSSQASGWDRKIVVGKDNGSWASINYDYSLETNKEYLFEKQQLLSYENSLSSVNSSFLIMIAAVILIGLGLILLIVKTIKKGKLEFEKEQQIKDAEIAEAKAKSDEAQKRANQISRTCEYCGSKVPDGKSECPNCGSSFFK